MAIPQYHDSHEIVIAVTFPMLGDVCRALAQGFGVLSDAGVAVRPSFNPEGRIVSHGTTRRVSSASP